MQKPSHALTNPVAFMGLLGKVLPMQVAGEGDRPLENQVVGRAGASGGIGGWL